MRSEAITPNLIGQIKTCKNAENGVPLEIISKIILRNQDLKTTQVYLGKISESEAIRWMDIYGK
jgi:hypothetical protein